MFAQACPGKSEWGITVNNFQTADRYGLESCRGRMGCATEGEHRSDRYGSVDEVAALVAFVAGPEASYITGANLMDGGTAPDQYARAGPLEGATYPVRWRVEALRI